MNKRIYIKRIKDTSKDTIMVLRADWLTKSYYKIIVKLYFGSISEECKLPEWLLVIIVLYFFYIRPQSTYRPPYISYIKSFCEIVKTIWLRLKETPWISWIIFDEAFDNLERQLGFFFRLPLCLPLRPQW